MKVFGIGCTKTGTTSLVKALKILGYKHTFTITPVTVQNYEAFIGDQTMHIDFQHYDENFDAKFILTTRRSPEVWYNSLCRWSTRSDKVRNAHVLNFREVTYGYSMPQGHQEEFINQYLTRNKERRNYFKDKDNFLEICFEKNDSDTNWKILCDFLDKQIPDIDFPHSNQNKYASIIK
jgi:hypothetical protein